ncbi:Fungal transcriptional regulatory protein [Penicillium brevicompactum]
MDDIQDQEPDNNGSVDPSSAPSGPRRHPKKRTKTGCLTCRKRRIKCGEEKPICTNCVKSKRICEGYAQRVVFKNPIGIFGAFNHPQNYDPQLQHHYTTPQLYNDYGSQLPPQQAAAAAQHPMLAPRPVDPATIAYHSAPSQLASVSQAQQVNGHQFSRHIAQPVAPPSAPPQPPADTWRGQSMGLPGNISRQPTTSDYSQPRHPIHSNQFNDLQGHQVTMQNQPSFSSPIGQTAEEYASNLSPLPAINAVSGGTSRNFGPIPQVTQPLPTIYHYQTPPGQLPPPSRPHDQFIPHQPSSQVIFMEDESEDYYDVDSDDEMGDQSQAEGFNQLSLIMASANYDERKLRSFTTHLNEPNVLASYRPSLGSSPLNNPKTARIFAHFIHSTGPSLSIFERHPTDSSIVLGATVPSAQQGLWIYTLALKALENPALLQAILAVSSLHIAYLQQVPSTVSLKHYHYALKRVGSAVGLPLRRKQVGTLAATLLLGYYEVVSADHSKWNNHVAGSAHLIREIDFAGTVRDLRAHRRRVNGRRRQAQRSGSWWGMPGDVSEDDPFSEKESNVDEGLIGTLMGRIVNYDYFGGIEEGKKQSSKKHFTRKDIENFRIQCDLYWWYSKQDAFQSFIGGNKLLTPYSQWGQCPPRAGIGRLDAIYGSADHLWLLLARVTDFGFRDRKRKLKAMKTSGRGWSPGPDMFKFMGRFAGGPPGQKPGPPGGQSAGKPPGGAPGAHATGPPNKPPGGLPLDSQPPGGPTSADSPPMYGMVPPQPPPRLPTGFQDRPRGSSPDEDDQIEDVSFRAAEEEWEDILAAAKTFEYALGRDFQPLPVDVAPQISTPFGPALQYRTHTIAVIWGYYYAVRILLNRIHPSMPPAIMMAAGVVAPTTAEYAQNVGKIMSGVYYPQRYNLEAGSLSPNLGSALTEMTVPVFFAAVQYIDSGQRGWTISKLRDISRLTGFKSAEAIAGGCEKAWIGAAQQGRGPPYQRSFETERERELEKARQCEAVLEEVDDRRFVTVKPDRAHWAMGILEDMANLEV